MSKRSINKSLSVSKSISEALPISIAAKNYDTNKGFWIVASREMVDSTGDIIRTDGIDTTMYHNPDAGQYLKILVQHLYYLQDGTPAVVALVKDIVKTTTNYKNQQVKTLLLWCEWLTDDAGELLPLSKTYKQYMAAGGIDSGSVGMLVSEYKETKTGLDVTKSILYETSLVSVPALASANILRSLNLKKEPVMNNNKIDNKDDDTKTEEMDPITSPSGEVVMSESEEMNSDEPENEITDPNENETEDCTCNCKYCKEYRTMKENENNIEGNDKPNNNSEEMNNDEITEKKLNNIYSKIVESMNKSYLQIADRLSVIESNLVIYAKKNQQPSINNQKVVAEDSETKRLLAALNRIDKFLSK